MRVLSIFDHSGTMVEPWKAAGHTTLTVDIKDADRDDHAVMDLFTYANIQDLIEWGPDIIFSFTPCTDLAVCGSRHFKGKRKKNPDFQDEAMELFKTAVHIAAKDVTPYMIENPVSVASTMWRKPNYYFDPYEYGGYLPEDDVHPLWPQYITPRDAYPKKTGIWCGAGFVMPEKKEVPSVEDYPGWEKLGGKSERTKEIRSMTPRGFAQAVFEANERKL